MFFGPIASPSAVSRVLYSYCLAGLRRNCGRRTTGPGIHQRPFAGTGVPRIALPRRGNSSHHQPTRASASSASPGAECPSDASAAAWRAAQLRAQRAQRRTNTDAFYYTSAVIVAVVGLAYAAVPLYKAFCGATGSGGSAQAQAANGKGGGAEGDRFAREQMVPVVSAGRKLRVVFTSDTARALDWSFRPQQRSVVVDPGETALAFYTARNRSARDVTGVATYNVIPAYVGPYFNKIQCFCFEEQKLRAGEEVDMPIFFFIDPDMLDDPNCADIDEVTLAYTFFNARTIEPSLLHTVSSADDEARIAAAAPAVPAAA